MRTLPLALLLAGCAPFAIVSTRPPPPGLAQVCVLRPAELSDATLLVRDNAAFVGATRKASYFCYYALPGFHAIDSRDDDDELGRSVLALVLAANRRYFVEQVLSVVGERHWLEWLDETVGLRRLRGCDYVVVMLPPCCATSGRSPGRGPAPAPD